MVRVLLDEDLPLRLRLHFPDGFLVRTVEYQGWKGLRNGGLPRLVEWLPACRPGEAVRLLPPETAPI